MQLSDTAKNKRDIKKLQDLASDKIVEKELSQIPGAIKRFEKLEAKVKKLEKQNKGQEIRIQKLIDEKFKREMGGDNVSKK
jgi:hypothetical protein